MTGRRLAMGQSFALYLDRVLEAADQTQEPWPTLLVRWAVRGLWSDALKKDALVVYIPLAHLRWEPPATMVALLPPGVSGETVVPRVVDAGNLASYFSYPLSQHGTEDDVRTSGSDYAVVPSEPLSRFQVDGRTYAHENHWAVIERD